jgi:hypothetical protein
MDARMKLTRMTVQAMRSAIDEKRRKGDTTDPVLSDKKLKRDAIEAWLLDGADLMIVLGIAKNDINQTIAKLRVELRKLGGAEDA